MRWILERREGGQWAVADSVDGTLADGGLHATEEAARAHLLDLRLAADDGTNPDAQSLVPPHPADRLTPLSAKVMHAAAKTGVYSGPGSAQDKAHVTIHGITVLIENAVGSYRSGKDAIGNTWCTEMRDNYGEIARSEGTDRDPVDVFVGPNPDSTRVWVIDQVDKFGRFDEHKVILGAETEEEARNIYLRNYEAGWTGLGGIVEMDLDELKLWARNGNHRWPVSPTLQGDVPPRIHAGDALGDDEELCTDDTADWELVGDDATGLRIRQRMTRADSLNRNDRTYPRDVLQDAIDRARPRARAGSMLSTKKHPPVAIVGGVDHFVDVPEKTARVDDFSDVGADGWVYCYRTILPTPEGDEIASKVRAGVPPGISTRFKMKGRSTVVNGRSVKVATWMDILSVDDVPNPAVDGAGAFELLSDAERDSIGAEETTPMNRFNQAANAMWALIALHAAADQVEAGRTALGNEFQELVKAGSDDVKDAAKVVLEIDAAISQGYRSGATAPTFTAANMAHGEGGYAPDALRLTNQAGPGATPQHDLPTQEGDGLSKADIDFLRQQIETGRRAAADAERDRDVRAAADAAISKLAGFDASAKAAIHKIVLAQASSAAAVDGMVQALADGISAEVAKAHLASRGLAVGQTVTDPGAPSSVVRENHSCLEAVDQILAASDAIRRRAAGMDLTADDVARRKYNRGFVNQLMDDWLTRTSRAKNLDEFMAATDSEDDTVSAGMDAMFQVAQQCSRAAVDSTVLTSMYNQPLIMVALLVQCFQDMRALQFVEGIGPGLDRNDGMGGWTMRPDGQGGLGTTFRIPVEYYVPPTTGYGMYSGPLADGGLLVPENTAIPEAIVKTTWLEFAPVWRRIGFSTSSDVMAAMGNGPLNYPVVARHLYHVSQHKARVIDHALFEQMLDIADRYEPTTKTGESQNLANNTVFLSGGSVTINLNPTKLAKTTPVDATDVHVTYGTNVIGACRLRTGSAGSSSPYCGDTGGYGPAPLVRPYTQVTLSAKGLRSTSTVYPITVSAPGAMVEGVIDEDGNIQDAPGGSTATYAVDHEHGVIVFKSGVSDNSGVINEAITVTYSYATNYEDFYLRLVDNAGATLLATGETELAYYSRLLAKLDMAAAQMGMAPRYMAPNLGIMDLIVAAKIQAATIFYKLNSPDGTGYGPTPDFFANRNGVNLARHNTPWRAGSTRLLLTRRGSTKYAIDTPMRVVGPVQKYDQATAQAVAGQIWYLEENSAQFTAQVEDEAGTIMNPVSYSIKFR